MKNKKLLILVDKIYKKHQTLADAVGKTDSSIETFLKKINDIEILIEKRDVQIRVGGMDLKDFDIVFFRRVGDMHVVGSVIVYLDHWGIPFMDGGLRKTALRGDKLTSLIRCHLAGVATIPTYYCHFKSLDKNIKILGKKFGYPLIAKKIHEHFLKGVYIVKDENDIKVLKTKASNSRNKRFIFQPFLTLSHEYRFLVLGNKVGVVHTRVERNYDKMKVGYVDPEAIEVYIDPEKVPNKVKNLAIKAAKALGLEIAGVDICVEEKTGKTFVLEVNRGPAFNYDRKISPEVSEVAKYIGSKLRKRI